MSLRVGPWATRIAAALLRAAGIRDPLGGRDARDDGHELLQPQRLRMQRLWQALVSR